MGKVSVALCIPTYERSEWIADFLENYAPHYIEAGIDIYYYDGSESTKTEEVVCGYPQQEHVYYIKRPSKPYPVVMIFQGYGLHKEYDFIWLCNDAVQLRKDAITILMANLNIEYDIVQVNGSGHGSGTKIFHNYNEYMQQCAWHTTLFGATLLNTHTMLNEVNWNNYEDLLNAQYALYWQVAFYFRRIVELDRFCALHIAIDPQIVRTSKYKKAPGWMQQQFFQTIEEWVRTIEGLPDCYTGKDIAIKKFDNFGLLSSKVLCYLRMDGIYSLKEYIKYKHILAKSSTMPKNKMIILALAPKVCVRRFVESKIRKRRELRKLQKLYKSFSPIVIFGIGETAFRYAQYFEQQGLEFKGFCAQRPHGKKEYMGHPIFSIDDVAQMGHIGVIVALGQDGANVAIPDICEKLSADRVYFSSDLEPVLLYETGYKMA